MTTYVILLPGDEGPWEAASLEQRAATCAEHDRFSRTLEERGRRHGRDPRLPGRLDQPSEGA